MEKHNKKELLKKSRFSLRSVLLAACSLLFAFLILVIDVAAWGDYSQHKTNVFSGTREVTDLTVILNKYEKDSNGIITTIPVINAEFELYTEDGTLIGGPYMTDEYGQIYLHKLRLEPGTYYFLETNPSGGFVYDEENGEEIRKYYFTVQGDETETVVVTAYNRRQFGALTIHKVVENEDSSPLAPEQLDIDFEFTITFSDGNTYDCDIGGNTYTVSSGGKIYLKHGQTAVFSSLPVGVEYTVTETPVPGYSIRKENEEGTITLEISAVTFTNVYALQVILEKYEKDADGGITTIPVANAVFYLYSEDGTLIAGPFTTDGQGKIVLDGTALSAGTYYFMETGLPYGYSYDILEGDTVTKYYFTVDENTSVSPIIVTAYNRKDPGALDLVKIVKNGDGSELSDEQKELQFEFTVVFSDGGTYRYTIDENEFLLPSGGQIYLKHGQKAVFESLPVGITYRITETPVPGYQIRSENHRGTISYEITNVLFTNTYSEEEGEESELIIRKTVEGEGFDRDIEFPFVLIVNGEETRFTLKAGEEKRFTIPFGALYEVYEEDVEGFIGKSITNGYGTASEIIIEIEQINEYISPPDILLEGEKIWELQGEDVPLPESIKIYIKKGDEVVAVIYVTAEQDWKWSITLPKYEEDGVTEIEYRVEEEPVEGFESWIEGWNIINTYLPIQPARIEIPVEKQVEGDPDADEVFVFTLQALADGTPMPADSQEGSKYIEITGAGKGTFGEIFYQEEGVYRYLIEEQEGDLSEYLYDSSAYLVTVSVTLEGRTLIPKVQIQWIEEGIYEAWDGDIIFINIYEEPIDPPPKPVPSPTPSPTPKPDPSPTTVPKPDPVPTTKPKGESVETDIISKTPKTDDASGDLQFLYILLIASGAVIIRTVRRRSLKR